MIFETVIGLEIHAELATKSKIFCSCRTDFGAPRNSQVCPVCLGHPGTLPRLNRKVVEYAAMAGLATGCRIAEFSRMDRKNYFYPDLPKAYQISQDAHPLCLDGGLTIGTEDGEKFVRIERIHIEEDAGKLIHARGETLADYNRCGVPLIEVVTAPDMRSAAEARAFVSELRTTLRYLGVSDCRMQEGSLRCDVNISVRPAGSEKLGERTEIKNLNSFQFIEKAIEYESRRQADILTAGGTVRRETRRFDEQTGTTHTLREKETAADYRFFPEPDIPPLRLTPADIEALAARLPELPAARRKRYAALGFPPADVHILTEDRALSDYFDRALAAGQHPKITANLLLSEYLRLSEGESFVCPVAPERLAAVADLAGEGAVNASTAKKLAARLWEGDFDPAETVRREGLGQICDEETLLEGIRAVFYENAALISQIRAGKTAAVKALVGKCMGRFGGRAEPRLLNRLVEEELKK
ncbi:MAG: Asp-tRNA(Asn)/Glu-tRNA(Gln) amidotransferase subunit GatB [Clostridia bacterium]|nr:Asp-tRNA(Asn)/Glu-tRNA(Gln) amidotransferase subunit GatB [Clostridia bacterium]